MNKSTDRSVVTPPEGLLAEEFLNQEFRLLERYELQGELVQVLENTVHHRHLVPKVSACHKTFRHWRCENSHDWAEAENSCSVRVCPHCSHRRSKILAARTQEFLVGKTGLRYAVLAERNSANLQEGIASLWASWTRLRRSVCWKRKVKGCMVVLEVTYNRAKATWHPHLNVLMEGEYFPFEELRKAWSEATSHRGRTSFIRAADEGTVHELIKYVTKISDLLDHANALDEFLTASAGKRFIRTYGTFRGLSLAEDDNAEKRGQCPDCGPNISVSIVQLGYVYPHQMSFDFEKGVFRVDRARDSIDRDLHTAEEFYPEWDNACAITNRLRVQRMHEAKREGKWGKRFKSSVKEIASQTSLRQPAA